MNHRASQIVLATAIIAALALAWLYLAQRSGIDGCDHGDTVCSDIARRVQ